MFLGMEWYWWVLILIVVIISLPLKMKLLRKLNNMKQDKFGDKND